MSREQEEAQKRLDRAMVELEGCVKISSATMEWLAADIAAGADPAAMSIRLHGGGRGRLEEKTSALVIAAARGWVEIVSIFLQDAELDANVADTEGDHALLAALKAGRGKAAQLLLPRSHVALADKRGMSCLASAVERELDDEAAAIVERMSDVERQQEFEKMQAQSWPWDFSSSQGGLRMNIQALLRSKMESGVLARAAGAACPKEAGSPSKPSRL